MKIIQLPDRQEIINSATAMESRILQFRDSLKKLFAEKPKDAPEERSEPKETNQNWRETNPLGMFTPFSPYDQTKIIQHGGTVNK